MRSRGLQAGIADVLRSGQWTAGHVRQSTLPASRTSAMTGSYAHSMAQDSAKAGHYDSGRPEGRHYSFLAFFHASIRFLIASSDPRSVGR
jgi:hypothetical protein